MQKQGEWMLLPRSLVGHILGSFSFLLESRAWRGYVGGNLPHLCLMVIVFCSPLLCEFEIASQAGSFAAVLSWDFSFSYIWKPVIPLNCCFVVFVICLFVDIFLLFLDFYFMNICWIPTRPRYVSEHWGPKDVWNTRVQCVPVPCFQPLLVNGHIPQGYPVPKLGNSKHSDPTLIPEQNKTKQKLAMLTQFSSYATMWEKCPKTKAVKIKLPTFWPLAHRGQSSPCLVSSDNCYDPALTDKTHLAHYHFLNDAIWKGQTRFLAKQSPEERKQGWGIRGSAYYIVCGNISKRTSWVLTPREWDLTPWGRLIDTFWKSISGKYHICMVHTHTWKTTDLIWPFCRGKKHGPEEEGDWFKATHLVSGRWRCFGS